MAKSCSLIIAKPDVIERKLESEVKELVNSSELRIIRKVKLSLDMELVKVLYQWTVVHHFKALQEYLCTSEVEMWLVEGDNAIEKCLQIKDKIRANHQIDRLHTLLHCPDTEEDFKREYEIFFCGEQLLGLP